MLTPVCSMQKTLSQLQLNQYIWPDKAYYMQVTKWEHTNQSGKSISTHKW